MGTGDGRAVLALARAHPDRFVLGLDANAAAMAEASRRAARAADRGGLENALFVVAAAETPPAELLRQAEVVTVTLPWGSLLDGILGCNEEVAAGLASLLRPERELVAILALTDRDGVGSIDDLRANGALAVRDIRRATAEEVAATHSSWAKRLRRPDAWRVTMRPRVDVRVGEPPRSDRLAICPPVILRE